MKVINIAILVSAVILTGCGGGGGGGGSTGVVSMPTTPPLDYTLGTRDDTYRPGGAWEQGGNGDVRTVTSFHFPNGVGLLHKRIQGPRPNDRSLKVRTPPRDVREAWHNGWTGKGANILIMDDFGLAGVPEAIDEGVHGYTVTMSALEVADGANYYSLNAGLSGTNVAIGQGGVRNIFDDTSGHQLVRFDVVNISFGDATPLSETEVSTTIALFEDPAYLDSLRLPKDPSAPQNVGDAVITKSAGNDGVDAKRDGLNLLFTTLGPSSQRTLIVGALDDYGQNGNAHIASYSNYAGNLARIRDRFLVEYGGSPYTETARLCLRSVARDCLVTDLSSETDVGTSFAAPRVAGFAALVRGKFPGLNGEQTAKILLDTATTAGLACHTGSARKSLNCAKDIYGQGRVDIADALSPIGKLN